MKLALPWAFWRRAVLRSPTRMWSRQLQDLWRECRWRTSTRTASRGSPGRRIPCCTTSRQWTIWWSNLELMQVVPPVGQIWNKFWWYHLVVKFWTNTSGTTYNWPNFKPLQVALYLAGEITQVKESIPWVRCASGNVWEEYHHWIFWRSDHCNQWFFNLHSVLGSCDPNPIIFMRYKLVDM